MENVLITGGTGLIGKALSNLLEKEGYNVRILSRNPKYENEFKWNIKDKFIDKKVFEKLHHIVHLAGAGIADERWTPKRKQLIKDSRVESANLLFREINSLKIPLKSFISASGIGFYGAVTNTYVYAESDAAGNDFLAEVCQKWEAAALQFENIGVSTTILRTGIVLSAQGGALEKMKTPIISPLGSGNQYMSWIHINDLCRIYLNAIEGKLQGVFNAVSPEYHTNKSFSKALAKSIQKPYLPFGVPAMALKAVFGEMAIILLTGSKVSANKILKANFTFKFEKLSEALTDLFRS